MNVGTKWSEFVSLLGTYEDNGYDGAEHLFCDNLCKNFLRHKHKILVTGTSPSLEFQGQVPKDASLSFYSYHSIPDEVFDSIAITDYSFGNSDEQLDHHSLIKMMYSKMSGRGALLLRLIGRDILEKYFHPKYWIRLKNGIYLMNERSMDYDTGILQEHYVIIVNHQEFEFKLKKKLFYPEDIVNFLNDANFTDVQLYGDSDKIEYNENSKCLFVSCRPKKLEGNFLKC